MAFSKQAIVLAIGASASSHSPLKRLAKVAAKANAERAASAVSVGAQPAASVGAPAAEIQPGKLQGLKRKYQASASSTPPAVASASADASSGEGRLQAMIRKSVERAADLAKSILPEQTDKTTATTAQAKSQASSEPIRTSSGKLFARKVETTTVCGSSRDRALFSGREAPVSGEIQREPTYPAFPKPPSDEAAGLVNVDGQNSITITLNLVRRHLTGLEATTGDDELDRVVDLDLDNRPIKDANGNVQMITLRDQLLKKLDRVEQLRNEWTAEWENVAAAGVAMSAKKAESSSMDHAAIHETEAIEAGYFAMEKALYEKMYEFDVLYWQLVAGTMRTIGGDVQGLSLHENWDLEKELGFFAKKMKSYHDLIDWSYRPERHWGHLTRIQRVKFCQTVGQQWTVFGQAQLPDNHHAMDGRSLESLTSTLSPEMIAYLHSIENGVPDATQLKELHDSYKTEIVGFQNLFADLVHGAVMGGSVTRKAHSGPNTAASTERLTQAEKFRRATGFGVTEPETTDVAAKTDTPAAKPETSQSETPQPESKPGKWGVFSSMSWSGLIAFDFGLFFLLFLIYCGLCKTRKVKDEGPFGVELSPKKSFAIDVGPDPFDEHQTSQLKNRRLTL